MKLNFFFHPFTRHIANRAVFKQQQTFPSNEILKNSEYSKYLTLIHQRTEITTNHLTPEIKLRLCPPHAQIVEDFLNNEVEDIFWAFYWPGGQVLSRYILDHPESVKNLEVLDVGCGCGATAIAAAVSGAKQVIANDIDSVACTSVSLNAELNDVQLGILKNNILGIEDLPWNCILMGDMLYEQELTSRVLKWLEYLHEKGKRILIGDPGRISLAAYSNFKLLAEYKLPLTVVEENRGFSHGYVWTYVK